jgi:cytochrome c oxidase subunit 2
MIQDRAKEIRGKRKSVMRNAFLIGALIGVSFLFSAAPECSQPALAATEQVIAITAKTFAFVPNQIKVKKGVPVVLKLTSADKAHGIFLTGLNLRSDIKPGKTSELRFTPEKTGTINFYCDVFCGDGHDDMNGKIIVTE